MYNNKSSDHGGRNMNYSRAHILQLAASTQANDGVVVDFDDGHVPESFKQQQRQREDDDKDANNNYSRTKLVRYPSLVEDRIPTVHVIQQAVPNSLVDALYHVTANLDGKDPKPWGAYVSLDLVRGFWAKNPTKDNNCSFEKENLRLEDREDLAVAAASFFFQTALDASLEHSDAAGVQQSQKRYHRTKYENDATQKHSSPPLWTSEDHEYKAHGVAVWALASTEKSQVPYHLDYAEQIRYQSNLIVPPLLAGTLQCTPTNMTGGDFCVCMDGLGHYETHGYKGKKSMILIDTNIDQQAEQQPSSPAESFSYDYTKDTTAEWIRVPYRYNQMILQSGHLPHLSTPVISMEPLQGTKEEHQQQAITPPLKRVILGFNVFGHDYGPLVQEAPEHSDIFRRKVTLQRVVNSRSKKERVSLEAIHANKGLSKLLVLAKREKVKQELQDAQQKLDQALDNYLMEHQQEESDSQVVGVSVEVLMSALAQNDGQTWPSPDDVQVHINQRLLPSSSSTALKENNSQGAGKSAKQAAKLLKLKEGEIIGDHGRRQRMVSPTDIVYLA